MKIRNILFLFLILVLAACSHVAKEVVEEPAAPSIENPCGDVEGVQLDATLVSEQIIESENAVQSLKVDLEYAKRDNKDVAAIEGSLREEETSLAKLNADLKALQDSIAEC